MRELSLDQLRTFMAVADLGSFSAAARALHLAQPTVSLHVSELESRLGAALLVRGRRIAPTPAGAGLLAHARRLLREAAEAEGEVRRHAAGRTGRVRLGTSTSVLAHVLPPVLQALQEAHPEIELAITPLASHETLARLADGTLDLGLVALPQAPRRDLVLDRWRSDPMAAFVPPQWRAPRRATPAWLAEQPLLLSDSATQLRRLTMQWFAAAGFHPAPRIELEATEAIKSLVAAGMGAAVLPLEGGPDSGVHSRLQVLPLRPALKRQLAIAHRPLSQLDAATHEALKLLQRFRQL